MDLKDIKAIVDLMKKNSLSEFELEHQDFKIKLKRNPSPTAAPLEDQPVYVVQPPAPAIVPPLASQSVLQPVVQEYLEIKSPMIGTFYRAASPESSDLVEVGMHGCASHLLGEFPAFWPHHKGEW